MRPEQAIKELKTDSCYKCDYGCNITECLCEQCQFKDAVKMAIRALERTTEPRGCTIEEVEE